MEIVKNTVGNDCWNIIIDYLAGDKEYNKKIFSNIIISLKMRYKIYTIVQDSYNIYWGKNKYNEFYNFALQ